ncbi:bifunctional hydroxymethylpyrimidine kinase/phosphomethylpyrimidine kinase [Microbacterium album]|uniref:Hydroxymethylpyrimidine kinase n=1 Tax=Microbacterium album TaxID=2053191 RepID=A0A917IHY4_9MICO|nr:bifunctional hydroxymethylpyrimidine kinase/phosphomethylpyrimidine kinase [Microbacterium album]GGH49755.1 hypothetical protein GCM10010921_28050 [Microbacterium album]
MSGIPHVLAVAGSDPSGGAGVQADIKSIMACGGYGMAALTALTAQSTQGVSAVHAPPTGFLRQQLDTLASDVRIDAVKIGMLGTAAAIDTVSAWLDALPERPPVVLDPVMVATSGDRLLDPEAERALHGLIARADVVTPNLPELAALVDEPVARDWGVALRQVRGLAARHDVLVLAKGGHLDGPRCPDALVGPDGPIATFDDERIPTTSTHGTGCSLSSALATLYARERDWPWATRLARAWVRRAIEAADALDVGRPGGHGPLHHAHALWSGERPPRRSAEPDAWWEDIAALRRELDEVWFVRQLADGSLDPARFAAYLEQDALYLGAYARLLERASELAPDSAESAFWAEAARRCVTEELALHRSYLAPGGADDGSSPHAAAPSAETAAYLAHLERAAQAGDHAVLVAALLPCFWLYQDLGARLASVSREGHPYAEWLDAYGDPGFASATAEAIAWTRRAARAASDDRVARMRAAFETSCRHELAFFAQTGATTP